MNDDVITVLKFATDGNADETYAKIRETDDSELNDIADKYESGEFGDSMLCDLVINLLIGRTDEQ